MRTAYKILLLTILSLSFPIGKLFEIFIWNNRITKTEIVTSNQRSELKGKTCSFIKISREILKKFTIHLQDKSEFRVIERIASLKNKQTLTTQINKTDGLKALLIKRFILNVFYTDDYVSSLR